MIQQTPTTPASIFNTFHTPAALPAVEVPFPTTARATDYGTLDAWLSGRRFGIGASDSAGIFGEGYVGQSECSVAIDKMGLADTGPEDCEQFECGHALQSGILELASRRIGCEVINPGNFTIFQSCDFPWLLASLDGACVHDDGPAPVEAKNVSTFLAKDWDDEENPPLKFQIQCQHQMAVTGHQHAFLVGLIGGNKVRVRRIARNERFIEQALIPKLDQFWKLVTEGRAAIAAGESPRLPPVDGSEGTRRALAKLYADDNGEEVFLTDPALVQAAADLAGAKEKIKALEELESYAKNQLVAAIGPASFAVLPNGQRFSYKAQTRTEKPRTLEECKSTTFRVLRFAK